MMEPFCKNNERTLAISFFRKKNYIIDNQVGSKNLFKYFSE